MNQTTALRIIWIPHRWNQCSETCSVRPIKIHITICILKSNHVTLCIKQIIVDILAAEEKNIMHNISVVNNITVMEEQKASILHKASHI